MGNDHERHFLYIDGKAIPVSEQVYRAYWHYTDKEDYFMRLQKVEGISIDQQTRTVVFTPSREDSMERLMGTGEQFVAEELSVEDQAVSNLWMETLMEMLTPEERGIVHHFYILGKTERDACAALGLPKTTFRRREKRLREKLRILLKDFF